MTDLTREQECEVSGSYELDETRGEKMRDMVIKKSGFVEPAADLETAVTTYQMMADFVRSVLRENVDFGTVGGVTKPTLLKPGAEKLLRFFGMYSQMELQEKIEDWTGQNHGGEPFFFYRYKAKAIRDGEVVAEGIGSCNSWEKKYRYRTGHLVCPECGQELRKSKHKEEYYCWVKTGGCGATFDANDPKITGQDVGTVVNPNPADVVNTVDKMAQKRALVAVALVACNASEYFTQDIEDLDFVEGSYEIMTKIKAEPERQPVAYQGQPIAPREKVVMPQSRLKQAAEELLPEYEAQAWESDQPKKYDFKTRPYDPETLREALIRSAKDKRPASDAQIKLLASKLSEYYGDANKVSDAKRYLFGSPHLSDADRKLITAALDWLNLSRDGSYEIDPMAKKELGKILDEYMRASGQESFL